MKRTLVAGRVVPVVLFVCAVATGCQQDQKPIVSLDRAKQITAGFQGGQFVAPPRTIQDVTAILDQHSPSSSELSTLGAKVQAQPPASASPSELYQFYIDRGAAAGTLGMLQQRLRDLRQASDIATKSGMDPTRVLQALRGAEFAVGNNRTALEHATRALNATLSNERVSTASYQQLATVQVALGDLAGARKSIESAEIALGNPQFRRYPQFTSMFPDYSASIQTAKYSLAMAEGRYSDAENHARAALTHYLQARQNEARSRALLPDLPVGVYAAIDASGPSQIGGALLRLDRPVEAEAEYRRALLRALQIWGRYHPSTSNYIMGLANALYAQGRYNETRQLADIAIDVYERAGLTKGSTNAARGYGLRARALVAGGDLAGAFKAWDLAAAVFADDPRLRFQYVEGQTDYVLTYAAGGRAADVIATAERIVANRQQRLGNNAYETAEARGVLAVALAKAGRRDEAMAAFRLAVPILMQTSRQSDDASGNIDRDRRLQQILETYLGLIGGAGRGTPSGADAAEAFRIADSIRSRGVQRALAASAARLDLKDPVLADLARREQDAQKQIAARFGLLTSALASPADQQDPAALKELRTQIDSLRDARAALRGEIERKFPDYANLIDPRPSRIEEVQASMRPGEAMLAIFVGQERTFVWGVPAKGPAAFASVDMGERQVAAMVAELRKALDPNAATLGDIPAFDVKLAHALYRQIVVPVSDGLKGADSLLVVPDKALGQLPFGLLVTADTSLREGSGALFANYKQVPFLIRQAAITQLPSVAALNTLRKLPAGSSERRAFAGFGDPWFSVEQARLAEAATAQPVQVAGLATRGRPLLRRSAPQTTGVSSAELAALPRLPDTADEVQAIAAALKADPAQDVFLGRRASETMVRTTNLADRKVILFATHGLVPGDLNGLTQPALALSAPQVAGGTGDGLLTMDKILGLRLDADWVVLSACNTAASDGTGAEAASGLGLAFFYAGTRALLLSNWPVETTSARMLTTDMFRRQTENANLGRAKAMQSAMLSLVDGDGFVEGGKVVFSYAHPIFWAPFSVIGDGGGGAAGS